MGRKPYTEKGSCRDQHYNGTLPSECFCSVCKYHAGLSDDGLRQMVQNNSIQIKSVCKHLMRSISPDTIFTREDYFNSTNNKRKRTAREFFCLILI